MNPVIQFSFVFFYGTFNHWVLLPNKKPLEKAYSSLASGYQFWNSFWVRLVDVCLLLISALRSHQDQTCVGLVHTTTVSVTCASILLYLKGLVSFCLLHFLCLSLPLLFHRISWAVGEGGFDGESHLGPSVPRTLHNVWLWITVLIPIYYRTRSPGDVSARHSSCTIYVLPRVQNPKDHQDTRSNAKEKTHFYYSSMLGPTILYNGGMATPWEGGRGVF